MRAGHDGASSSGRKVTVRDVAAAAGVSPATASRALSGNGSVNPEMVRRVHKASTDLGYSANVFARALRTERTDTIGMVVPSIANPYFVGAVEAVEKALASSGRSLILCNAGNSVQTEADRVGLLVQRMVDGLVVVPVDGSASVAALRAAAERVPLVQFDRVAAGASDGLRRQRQHRGRAAVPGPPARARLLVARLHRGAAHDEHSRRAPARVP